MTETTLKTRWVDVPEEERCRRISIFCRKMQRQGMHVLFWPMNVPLADDDWQEDVINER
jgi:hypothetical protein